MSIPTVDELRAKRDPRYNPRTTIAVAERVLRGWCGRSDAYLWNVENCQAKIIQLEQEFAQGRETASSVLLPHEATIPYAVVSYDNLEYGIEMTLKAAQLVDGYHQFNKDKDIPGFIENFEVGGFTYVYIKPTHRLDTIYNEFLSDTMKQALRDILPMKECLDLIYDVLHGTSMDLNWVAGSNHSAKTSIRYDSKRYSSDWGVGSLDPGFVWSLLTPLRLLNSAIPLWLHDRDLKARAPASWRAGVASTSIGPSRASVAAAPRCRPSAVRSPPSETLSLPQAWTARPG